MKFRKSLLADADEVTAIYDYAREEFKKMGIPQWQKGVPGRESFISDVFQGNSYVMTENGKIAGTLQIVGYEPTYEKVEGGSFSEATYLAAHRVAVSPEYRRRGVAGMMLSEVTEMAKKLGKRSVRIDTHENNTRMRTMLEKNGFKEVGTIMLSDGSPRIAYEKLI